MVGVAFSRCIYFLKGVESFLCGSGVCDNISDGKLLSHSACHIAVVAETEELLAPPDVGQPFLVGHGGPVRHDVNHVFLVPFCSYPSARDNILGRHSNRSRKSVWI